MIKYTLRAADRALVDTPNQKTRPTFACRACPASSAKRAEGLPGVGTVRPAGLRMMVVPLNARDAIPAKRVAVMVLRFVRHALVVSTCLILACVHRVHLAGCRRQVPRAVTSVNLAS